MRENQVLRYLCWAPHQFRGTKCTNYQPLTLKKFNNLSLFHLDVTYHYYQCKHYPNRPIYLFINSFTTSMDSLIQNISILTQLEKGTNYITKKLIKYPYSYQNILTITIIFACGESFNLKFYRLVSLRRISQERVVRACVIWISVHVVSV